MRTRVARTSRPRAGAKRTRGHLLFFFNDTATTEIYTLSLHDALPISGATNINTGGAAITTIGNAGAGSTALNSPVISAPNIATSASQTNVLVSVGGSILTDRKSTRVNSSHTCTTHTVSPFENTLGHSL